MIRRLAALPIVGLLVATGSWALAQSAGGKGWIDQPLGSVIITSTPVAVTAHLTHPAGVTEARLVVNGEEIEQKPAGGETLETVEFSWEPPGSGEYLLEVFGFGGGGWGFPGSVLVIVVLDGETTTTTIIDSTTTTASTTTTKPATTTTKPSTTTTKPSTTTTKPSTTTTSSSSTTTSSTTTTVPTTTTTLCELGVPSPSGESGTNTLNPTLYWSYPGCQEPEEFEIQVSRDAGFLRSEWLGSAGDYERSVQVSVGANCTTYYWRIRTYDLGSYGPWSSASSFFIQTGRSCP